MSYSDYIKERFNLKYKDISTGSDMLDLVTGKYRVGTGIHFLGASSSGKTFAVCELIYGAMKEHGKDNVEVGFLSTEGGFSFDTETMYGYSLEDCFRSSETVEDLISDIQIFADEKKKDTIGVYIVDSLDGLSSVEEQTMQEKAKKAFEKGEDFDEKSYRSGKSKKIHEFFRVIGGEWLVNNNMIVVIISQLKDNFESMGANWTYNGKRPLTHWPNYQLFFRQVELFGEKGRSSGYRAHVKALKSRTDTPFRECYLNCYFKSGMDNVGTSVDFLFDLADDSGKLNTEKCKAVQWDENGKEYSTAEVKSFIEEAGRMDDVRALDTKK